MEPGAFIRSVLGISLKSSSEHKCAVAEASSHFNVLVIVQTGDLFLHPFPSTAWTLSERIGIFVTLK